VKRSLAPSTACRELSIVQHRGADAAKCRRLGSADKSMGERNAGLHVLCMRIRLPGVPPTCRMLPGLESYAGFASAGEVRGTMAIDRESGAIDPEIISLERSRRLCIRGCIIGGFPIRPRDSTNEVRDEREPTVARSRKPRFNIMPSSSEIRSTFHDVISDHLGIYSLSLSLSLSLSSFSSLSLSRASSTSRMNTR